MHNNSFERMPTSTPKPRRRWHQFSLRTLLVVMVPLTGVQVWCNDGSGR